MVAIAVVAVPAYSSFISKAKMTEAMNLAGESKRKMSEFFMMNNRFPQNENEAKVAHTMTLSPPEYVREMVIETKADKSEREAPRNHDLRQMGRACFSLKTCPAHFLLGFLF